MKTQETRLSQIDITSVNLYHKTILSRILKSDDPIFLHFFLFIFSRTGLVQESQGKGASTANASAIIECKQFENSGPFVVLIINIAVITWWFKQQQHNHQQQHENIQLGHDNGRFRKKHYRIIIDETSSRFEQLIIEQQSINTSKFQHK